jgi:hypothetical protein
MGYIVYHINGRRSIKWYRTERGAKIGCTVMNRNANDFAYGVMEETAFNAVYNQKVAVKNMMSGKDVYINEQDVGGPCDPSTERYWSM